MKAAVIEGFGGADRVVVREWPRPMPLPAQVLVRVRAASMNPLDWKLRQGQLRLLWRLKPPFVGGFDLAGEVEAVGPAVTRFRAGDLVFGMLSRPGAHSELALAREGDLASKPAALSFEEAAAIPAAGLSALLVLRDLAPVRRGQHVLLNGAGGGIGGFAIQIAKAGGAKVTAVGSAGKQEAMRALGADECLDYAREDFARRQGAFDTIFDIAASRSFMECRQALAPGGVYVTSLPGGGPFFWALATFLARPLFGGRRCKLLILRPKRADLEELAALAGEGRLRANVGEVLPLERVREAYERMQSGHATGKIVLRIG